MSVRVERSNPSERYKNGLLLKNVNSRKSLTLCRTTTVAALSVKIASN